VIDRAFQSRGRRHPARGEVERCLPVNLLADVLENKPGDRGELPAVNLKEGMRPDDAKEAQSQGDEIRPLQVENSQVRNSW